MLRFVTVLILFAVVLPLEADEPSPAAALMNLLKSGKVPKERQGAIVKLVCERGNAADLGYIFAEALKPDAFNPEVRVLALRGLAEAAGTRKVQPAGDLSRVKQLLALDKKAEPALQQTAFELIGLWKVAALRPDLEKLALEAKTPEPLRQAALDGLVRLGGNDSRAIVEKLLAADRPTRLRFLGVAALARLDADAGAKAAADVLAKASDKDDPEPLLAAFFDLKGASDKLAAALDKQKPPADVAKLCLRYMYGAGRSDAALTATLSNAAGINLAKPINDKEVAQLVESVLAKGDPARGEAIFRRADLSCFNCHALNGAGGEVGPDLRDVGSAAPPDFIIKAILDPDSAIKEQYETVKILTADGKLYQGIVADENDARVILKDATGVRKTIAKADIEERVKGGSLMPKGLANFMTQAELIDLARFLSELGKQGPYAVQTRPTLRRYRLLKNPAEALLTTVPDDEALQDHVRNRDDSAWQAVYAQTNGDLPLDELAVRGGNHKVVYFKGALEVRSAGKVRLKLDASDGVSFWIDGKPVKLTESTVIEELPIGVHELLFRVDTAKRARPLFRVDYQRIIEGGADAVLLNGT